MDPSVTMTLASRQGWNAVLMDVHALQRRGTQTEATLRALYPQMQDAAFVQCFPETVGDQIAELDRRGDRRRRASNILDLQVERRGRRRRGRREQHAQESGRLHAGDQNVRPKRTTTLSELGISATL